MSAPADRSSLISVVGLPGSLRRESYTRLALEWALRGAAEVGAQTKVLDLGEYNLSFEDLNTPPSPGTLRLRQEITLAQGILIGTPEYHGSFSGVLKHALDLMGFAEFEGKLVGLIGVGGGKLGAVNALNGLRTVGRSLHAWVIPEQVSIAEVNKAFDTQGRPVDPAIEAALKTVGRQVARFAFLHTSTQAQEFLRLWETAPENPGAYLRDQGA
jgi:NAD(P)H-dependent FMN reductase